MWSQKGFFGSDSIWGFTAAWSATDLGFFLNSAQGFFKGKGMGEVNTVIMVKWPSAIFEHSCLQEKLLIKKKSNY